MSTVQRKLFIERYISSTTRPQLAIQISGQSLVLLSSQLKGATMDTSMDTTL